MRAYSSDLRGIGGLILRRVLVLAIAIALVPACTGDSDGERTTGDSDAASWKTWVLDDPTDVKVPPPPARGSAGAERDLRLLGEAITSRNGSDAEAAHFWSDAPAVEPWVNLGLDLVADQGVKNPPRAARGYALASVAMYDAIVAAKHWQNEYERAAPEESDALVRVESEFSYPSEHAAMAGAVSRVLAYVFPELPVARFDLLAEDAARSRVVAGANYPSDVRAGLALGRSIAKEVIARAEHDGAGDPYRGEVLEGEGYWEPPPGSVALPVEPGAGQWDPWVLESGDEFRPPPPPTWGSDEFMAEAEEVVRLTEDLTAEQEESADYWAAGAGSSLPPGMWNEIALRHVREAGLGVPQSARVFALLNVAQADAAIASWDCKYTYWSPRPINAIRELGLDRDWVPRLPTPLFPSYVSGHSTFSAASSEVLAYLFPEDAERLREMAEEAGMSRIYGGIHYQTDNEQGLALGRAIGRKVVAYARRDGADRSPAGTR